MLPNLGRSPIFFLTILTQIYGPFLKDFSAKRGPVMSPTVDCAPSPMLYNPVLDVSFHRKYYFVQEEEEMKLCLMILSVPWYMLNGLEHTAILSNCF